MKKFLFLFLFFPLKVQAALVCQTIYPSSVTVVPAFSGNGWNNLSNGFIEDGLVVSTTAPGAGTSYLNFTFTPVFPNSASILGIKAEIKENESTAILDNSVVLFDVNQSSAGCVDHKAIVDWPTPLTYVVYGSTSDLWGISWTPQRLSSVSFAVSCIKDSGGTQTAQVDVARLTVCASVPTTLNNATIRNGTLR